MRNLTDVRIFLSSSTHIVFYMATVVFDFDSTLISCESLEKILEQKCPHEKEHMRTLTEAGLRGKIPFSESLSKRLKLAAPTKEEASQLGEAAVKWITQGMPALIESLKKREVEVWIVSGGMQEFLLPVGKQLGIKPSHILGVKLLWGKKGEFLGINPTDPFSRSKVEGVKDLAEKWSRPRVAVGDAMSDYLLFEHGLVDRFILFTQHYKCQELLNKNLTTAVDVAMLKARLEKELGCSL